MSPLIRLLPVTFDVHQEVLVKPTTFVPPQRAVSVFENRRYVIANETRLYSKSDAMKPTLSSVEISNRNSPSLCHQIEPDSSSSRTLSCRLLTRIKNDEPQVGRTAGF